MRRNSASFNDSRSNTKITDATIGTRPDEDPLYRCAGDRIAGCKTGIIKCCPVTNLILWIGRGIRNALAHTYDMFRAGAPGDLGLDEGGINGLFPDRSAHRGPRVTFANGAKPHPSSRPWG